MNNEKKDDVDISSMMITDGNISAKEVISYMHTIKKSMNITITPSVDYEVSIYTIDNKSIVIDIYMSRMMNDRYNIHISIHTISMIDSDGNMMSIYVYDSIYQYNNTKGISYGNSTIIDAGDTISTMTDTNNDVSYTIWTCIISLDPTGIILRSTRLSLFVNKMYYINVNHGQKLEEFLLSTTSIVRYDPNIDRPQQVYNNKVYRGKISKQKTTLDAPHYKIYKIVLYIVSWIVKGLLYITINNIMMNKIGMYTLYHWHRVHLTIFSSLYCDFIWLAPRTLMHSHDLPYLTYNITWIITILMNIDIYVILNALLDHSTYRRAYKVRDRLRRLVVNTSVRQVTPIMNTTIDASTHTTSSSSRIENRDIDYDRTLYNISFNKRLMDVSLSTYRLDKEVYESTICRVLVLSLWIRLPFVYLCITTLQYCNTLMIAILVVIEVSILITHILAYMMYRYMKSMLAFIMDVVQHVCVIVYLMIVVLLSQKRYDEKIEESYQQYAIYCLMVAYFAQYAMLIGYIAIEISYFCRLRFMMKKNNYKKPEYEVILYKYESLDMRREERVVERERVDRIVERGRGLSVRHGK